MKKIEKEKSANPQPTYCFPVLRLHFVLVNMDYKLFRVVINTSTSKYNTQSFKSKGTNAAPNLILLWHILSSCERASTLQHWLFWHLAYYHRSKLHSCVHPSLSVCSISFKCPYPLVPEWDNEDWGWRDIWRETSEEQDISVMCGSAMHPPTHRHTHTPLSNMLRFKRLMEEQRLSGKRSS